MKTRFILALIPLVFCFEAHGAALFQNFFLRNDKALGLKNHNVVPKKAMSSLPTNRAVGTMDNAHRQGVNSGHARKSGRHWHSKTKDKTSCLPRRLTNQISSMGRYLGRSVQVVSAYRSPADNARRGGAKGSMHKHCKAVDFRVPGVSQAKVRGYLDALYRTGRWGVGYYCKGRFHLDTGNKRVWGGCYSRSIKYLIPKGKRKHATYQSVAVPNSAVAKTTKRKSSSGEQYPRLPAGKGVK